MFMCVQFFKYIYDGHVMEPAIKEMIRTQTSVTDNVLIERTYHECKGDIVQTIMKLSNLVSVEKEKTRNMFDELREILDAKDAILQDKIKESKRT